MTNLSEGYQQAEALRRQQEQDRLEAARTANVLATQQQLAAAQATLAPAEVSETQRLAAETRSRATALDAKINLINSTQQLNQTYQSLTDKLDATILQQQGIIDAAIGTNFVQADMDAAVTNLKTLTDQKSGLDEWYKKGVGDLATYNAQINLIAGGSGGAEYVVHKGDTYTVTYTVDGETKTEKFTNKHDANQFVNSLKSVVKPGEPYKITFVERNPAVLFSNLIQRGGSAIDAWISSGVSTPDAINKFVWGNLAKGAYGFVDMFDPAHYADIMRGVVDLPQTLPVALSDWAAIEPAIFKIMGDETPPLYERVGEWASTEPDVLAWMNQTPPYAVGLQLAGGLAAGYIAGGLFNALNSAPALTTAERLEILRTPPILNPKLKWGEYRSLMGSGAIDDLSGLAISEYGLRAGTFPLPPSMPTFIRSGLKWGNYPSLTQMKSIEKIGLKLTDYVYVDSEFSYPGYTLMKVQDPDGMYRLYLQTGSDLIEVPQESLLTGTRVTHIPQAAHFSLEDYNSILDDLRASTDLATVSGFKPQSLEDWNRVVTSIIEGKQKIITVLPPISLFKTDLMTDVAMKSETLSSMKIDPITELAIISALAELQITGAPQLTDTMVKTIQKTQLDQYVPVETIEDIVIDDPIIDNVPVSGPVVDVDKVPPPEVFKPKPREPPEGGWDEEPLLFKIPVKDEERRVSGGGVSERKGARFRVVLDGVVHGEVRADSFMGALQKVSRGKGRRAVVTRI